MHKCILAEHRDNRRLEQMCVWVCDFTSYHCIAHNNNNCVESGVYTSNVGCKKWKRRNRKEIHVAVIVHSLFFTCSFMWTYSSYIIEGMGEASIISLDELTWEEDLRFPLKRIEHQLLLLFLFCSSVLHIYQNIAAEAQIKIDLCKPYGGSRCRTVK